MKRVKFEKGFQRKFLNQVIESLNSPSLRAINQFGFSIPYSTLKNYSSEKRNLPEDFFKDLCFLAKIDPTILEIEYLEENFGQILGGKKSRKK